MMLLAEKITDRLFLALTGALAVLLYLEWAMQAPVTEVVQARKVLLLVWLFILLTRSFLDPKKKSPAHIDISPALSGTSLVLGTGLVAAYLVARESSGSTAILLAAVIGLLTLITAWFAYRFASKHAGEIGEARFASAPSESAKGTNL